MDTTSEPQLPPAAPKPGTPAYRALKPRIQGAIVNHLATVGSKNWNVIREDPDFASLVGEQAGGSGKKLFFNWVKALKAVSPPDKTRPHEGREASEAHLAFAEEQVQQRVRHQLPATPQQAYWLKHGADGQRRIDLAANLFEGFEDVERTRRCALHPDPEAFGGWSVSDPALLLQANRLRNEILRTAALLMPDLKQFDQQQVFVERVFNTVLSSLPDDPNIREPVIEALREVLLGAIVAGPKVKQ